MLNVMELLMTAIPVPGDMYASILSYTDKIDLKGVNLAEERLCTSFPVSMMTT